MIDQTKFEAMLNDSLPDIVKSFKEEITNSISCDVKNEASKIIKNYITDWMEQNVLPEITKMLIESKDGFIQIAKPLGEKLSDTLVEALVVEFHDKLNTSWNRKKIFKAMFDI